MQQLMVSLGLHSLVVGGLPSFNRRFKDLILVDQTPRDWLGRYVEQRYEDFDPVIRGLRCSAAPFAYTAEYGPDSEPRIKELAQARQHYKLREGLVIPVPRRDRTGLVWMSGERPELTPRTKAALHLMAYYAFDRIAGLLKPCASDRQKLTRREREVLQWAAVGKTAWEIGGILGIAKRTVDEHTRSATGKLGAVNRTRAVVIALRDRLIAI
jgi:LuxR family quorum sensing-dependent transcriptional regulator